MFKVQGSMAEWSKALVLGTSLSGVVGSNPTAAMNTLSGYLVEKRFCTTILDMKKNPNQSFKFQG